MWSVRPHQGWVVIGVVFLGMAVAIGGTHYSFGVFVEPLEREFGWSRTEVTASLILLCGLGVDGAVYRPSPGQVRGEACDDHLHPDSGVDFRSSAPDGKCRALVPDQLRPLRGIPRSVHAGGSEIGGQLVPADSGADDGGGVHGCKLRWDIPASVAGCADHGDNLALGVHNAGCYGGAGGDAGAPVRAGQKRRGKHSQ